MVVYDCSNLSLVDRTLCQHRASHSAFVGSARRGLAFYFGLPVPAAQDAHLCALLSEIQRSTLQRILGCKPCTETEKKPKKETEKERGLRETKAEDTDRQEQKEKKATWRFQLIPAGDRSRSARLSCQCAPAMRCPVLTQGTFFLAFACSYDATHGNSDTTGTGSTVPTPDALMQCMMHCTCRQEAEPNLLPRSARSTPPALTQGASFSDSRVEYDEAQERRDVAIAVTLPPYRRAHPLCAVQY